MEKKDLEGIAKKVDDIIKEVVPNLSEDKRLELINRLCEYLHINASMMTWDSSPEYYTTKKQINAN